MKRGKATVKKVVNSDFAFQDQVSELKLTNRPPRDLEQELFSKKGQKAKIDAFEKALGFPVAEKAPTKYKYHHKILNPSHDADGELLDELMNANSRYKIVMWKDNWTVHGDFKIFVIYSEEVPATSDPAEALSEHATAEAEGDN